MKRFVASLVLALIVITPHAGCGAGDDTVDGARGECALGGALTDCPDADRTAQGACWRLVDCEAIPLSAQDDNVFDWGNCVDHVEKLTADRERLVIDCVAASTCDALRVDGSPDLPNRSEMQCMVLGDQ